LLVAGVLGAAPVAAQPIKAEIVEPPVERYALANGLSVVLQHDPRQPTVAGVVAYGVGTRHDPPGYSGLAHLVEHMTFRGSRHLQWGEGMAHYASVGARANGTTATDHTIYSAEFPARHLPHFLWIESDRMGFTLEAMDAKRLEIERKVVRNEYRQRHIGSRIAEITQRTATPEDHPYHPIGDAVVDPGDIGFDDVRWFFQRYYRPDNAVLVLVGNLDLARTRELIEQYFGPLRAVGAPPPRTRVLAIAFGASQRLRFEQAGGLSQLAVRWSVPCGVDVGCHARLQLLAALLDRALADTDALASNVSLRLTQHEQHTDVVVTAWLRTPAASKALLERLDGELARLRRGIAPGELRAAQLSFAASRLYQRESLSSRAWALAVRPEPDSAAVVRAALELGVRDMSVATSRLLPVDRRLIVEIVKSRMGDYQGVLDDSEGSLDPHTPPPLTSRALEADP
jgi:predicted Zn-dependent peptidase